MSDEETRTGLAIRDRLTAAEPAIVVNPGEIRALAQARLRYRRLAAVGGAAVLVAGVTVGGVALGSALGGSKAPVAEGRATFSPDKLVTSMERTVSGHQGNSSAPTDTSWHLDEVIAEVGPTAKVLTGAERAKADRWQARFSDGADHKLDVILIYESPVKTDALAADCASTLGAKRADVCEAAPTSTGIPSQYIERAGYPMGEGWPVVNDPLLVEPVPAADQWYLHQVKIFNPDGLTVVATEVVHTSSADNAATEWTLTPEQLTQIATDPQLSFPDPG